MPDGVIQHKLMMDGVTLDILRFETAFLALSKALWRSLG